MFNKTLLLLSSIVVLTSCATTTTNKEVKSATRAEIPQMNDQWAVTASNDQFNINWSDRFNDPRLSGYIKEALTNNKDLTAAAANVDRSWALAKQAGASLKPNLGLSAGNTNSGDFTGQSGASNSYSVGAQVSWELDIWGRIKSGAMAAEASAQASALDFEFAKESLAAAVTKAYLTAIEAQLQMSLTQSIFDDTKERARIVDVKYKNGAASAQDVALIQTDLASIQEQLETVANGKNNAIRALEVLMGRYPSTELELTENLPVAPELPGAGLPSEVLERRPDVAAAERRVAAAFNNVNQAKAAKLPSFSLTSNIGGSSGQLSDILDPANTVWSLASNLLAPIFDGGARDAQVEISTADQKAALANYGQTALSVFQEIENNLALGVSLENREKLLTAAAQESQKALDIAQIRYKEGETDLLDVLTIQQRVTSAESNLIAIKRAVLEQRVNLHLALGGNW